jgi:menaquinone-dependent protoporphyrinogen oxidase
MKVLVSAASKHGATTDIAQAIGDVLSAAGIEADVLRPEEVTSVASYDGVVLGSGVYAGHWLRPAKSLVERELVTLASKPVWLFSSGPTGESPKPEQEPLDIAGIRESTHAIDHRVFAGKLDRRQLGFAERTIISIVHASEGDFRPWQAVTDWATGIAETMRARMVKASIP